MAVHEYWKGYEHVFSHLRLLSALPTVEFHSPILPQISRYLNSCALAVVFAKRYAVVYLITVKYRALPVVNKGYVIRVEILTSVNIKLAFFWEVTRCSWMRCLRAASAIRVVFGLGIVVLLRRRKQRSSRCSEQQL